jgi:hypothetical protein
MDSSNGNWNKGAAAEVASMQAPAEYTLTVLEKKFLLYAERGDCASVKRYNILLNCLTSNFSINFRERLKIVDAKRTMTLYQTLFN